LLAIGVSTGAAVRKTITHRTAALLFFCCRAGLCLGFILQTHISRALDADRRISQYAHTAWRTQDGLFSGSPNAIAQTLDGYIWIGTQSGLVRFDGVRFVPQESQSRLPSSPVVSLLADADGSLWIGTETGLIHRKNGAWITFPDVLGRVNSIVYDQKGSVWVVQTRMPVGAKPLCRVNDTKTQCYGEADGFSLPDGDAITVDQQGNIWVGSDTAILRWKPGSSSTYPVSELKNSLGQDGVDAILATRDGSLWAGTPMHGGGGLQKFMQGNWKAFVTPDLNGNTVDVQTLNLDRENNLWVGTIKHGLYRIHDAHVDHFGSADGLSSDNVYDCYEDREGNLWVATSKGLDNFRNTRVVSFSTREGLSADEVNSVLATRDGAVWIGSVGGLDVLHPNSLSPVPAEGAVPRDQITALLEDHAGRVWVGVRNSMMLYSEGRVREIRRPNGSPLGLAAGITEDTDNNIWIEVIGPPRTLIRIQDLKVQDQFPVPQLPAARKLAADPHGGIWLGLMSGDLAHYRNGMLEIVAFQHQPDSRVDQVFISPDGAVLGATAFGLIGWRDGRKQILTVQNGLPCNGINAIMTDRENALWLYAQCGLIEIPGAELARWWAQSDSTLQMRVFDTPDGVQAGDALFNASARSTDGRLWFPNRVVLQMIDPGKSAGNPLAPPVHIEEIFADRKSYSVQPDLRLPSLTRDVQINYTALSFVAPQKVRFRYRLDGYDRNWQEAGGRRQAFYNNLPPGNYRFKVIACNNDGVWNENGAALDFAITPAFYQTLWFKLLLLLSGLGLIWLLHTLRLRQATSQVQARLAERLEERGRIARELHDTLIQSVDGLMLRLQTALDQSDPEQSHQMIEKALDSADEVMSEGRQRVQALRGEATLVTELSEALRSYGNELAEDRPISFSVALVGYPKPMDAFVRDEAYRIGREALGNAFQHSGATRIEAEFTYDRALLRVRVRDDGVGIGQQILNGGKSGHYGLVGMRERAQTIGGRLVIASRPGAGTEINLEIPAQVAYQNGFRSPGLHFFKRLLGDKRGRQ
jgi:signal transduction histidine kinase/ligand-binding sensor domain-containing protein